MPQLSFTNFALKLEATTKIDTKRKVDEEKTKNKSRKLEPLLNWDDEIQDRDDDDIRKLLGKKDGNHC